MNHELKLLDSSLSDSDNDSAFGLLAPEEVSLETVLAAWNDATNRLQGTHEVLQKEVSRLRRELEVKNRELARKSRLADLGRMASHVAHEVRNSLVPVTLYMSLLKRRVSEDSDNVDLLTKVEAGLTALDVTVNDLLNFTSHREPRWEAFSLSGLIGEVCKSLEPQFEAQSIDISIDVPLSLSIQADREMMRRAILNLVLNSVEVMREGGELVFTSYEGGGSFELEIADSGPGLTEEQCDRAFDPFFTTKSDGTGLGLAIVHRIAEAHGGRVTAKNCSEGGAAFTIEIPRQAMGAAA